MRKRRLIAIIVGPLFVPVGFLFGYLADWPGLQTLRPHRVSRIFEIRSLRMSAEDLEDLRKRIMAEYRWREDWTGLRGIRLRAVGKHRIEVLEPKPLGLSDVELGAKVEADQHLIRSAERLRFRLLADQEVEREAKTRGITPSGCKWYPVAKGSEKSLDGRSSVLVWLEDGFDITGSYLANVGKTYDDKGLRAISFVLDDRGAKLFGRLTGLNEGRRLAIILDGQVQSAPVIQSRIDKRGIITGGSDGFTEREQDELIEALSTGIFLLPRVPLVSEKLVDGRAAGDTAKALAAMILFLVGVGVTLIGGVWFLQAAFTKSVWWGLACLFIPFVGVVFLVWHFRAALIPSATALLGAGMYVVAAFLAKAGG